MTDIYVLPDLPYDPGALEPHISGQIMELHHDKHHAAYVKGANATLAQLEETRATGDFGRLPMLEKNLAFHVSGHVLHSLFWTNLSPDGGGEPDAELGEVIGQGFGTFASFRTQMTQAAATIQGSGWALWVCQPRLAPACSPDLAPPWRGSGTLLRPAGSVSRSSLG